MMFFVYAYLVVFIIFDVFILLFGIEQIIRVKKRLAPEVPSSFKLRNSIAKQILIEYPNVKTVFDIGSGWGTLGRSIARKICKARVTGAEMMPTPYIYSSMRHMFIKNVKFVFGDAFKYLKKTDKIFDVGVVYLLTPEMGHVEKVLDKFKVLITADFPLPNTKPIKIIKLHKDFLGQHFLYVYKS